MEKKMGWTIYPVGCRGFYLQLYNGKRTDARFGKTPGLCVRHGKGGSDINNRGEKQMRRACALLLALTLVLALTAQLTQTGSADSLYIRKIVSVVYDDSTSMRGDKQACANYAMQAFCGMLNSEDQLYITYMSERLNSSNYQPERVDLSSGGIQNSIDTIRGHGVVSSTPYTAVTTAFDKLKSVHDDNPNTQYWLVVITDGSFDECSFMNAEKKREYLNDRFRDYAQTVMPNGTKPQLTFLGIGNVAAPDQDPARDIYTYSARNADEIMGAMSELADRISGRTRLKQSDMKKVNDTTIQVSSSIPLLNIAVFTQKNTARVLSANAAGDAIPVTRSAVLEYPGYTDLVGNACLLGDSRNVIGAGTYEISFDRPVDTQDVIVLFEPALEVRMTVTVNGQPVQNFGQLGDTMEGDKISVSYNIYEMGTNKQIDPSLMPTGTEFSLTVLENGSEVKRIDGQSGALTDYVLKNLDTEISASVTIDGFRPIIHNAKFTPAKYVHRVKYTITPSFGSGVKSVKMDDIAGNKDLTVCFTVYADGVAMTDVNAVKAINPVITVSPAGNDGTISYSGDGRIVYTPNKALAPAADLESFQVEVTCTIADGTSASEQYTVLISDYQVFAANGTAPVKKTGFFGNQVGVTFYITKDGVKMDKAAVEKQIAVSLNKAHSGLKTDVTVTPDGTITIVPCSEEDHPLTFWSWWGNWWYYFGLPGEDVEVTLSHAYGTEKGTVDVVEESVGYQILNVYLPLLIEVIALAVLITWIVLVVTKPRYLKGAVMYVGEIKYNRDNYTHTIRNFNAVRLEKFNKIKRGNGRLKFKKQADEVSANGIKIRADYDGRVICNMPFAWFRGKLETVDTDLALKKPAQVAEYIGRAKKLEIVEFALAERVEDELNRVLTPVNPSSPRYTVVPDVGNGIMDIDGRKVIRSGKIFIYINS